MNAFSVVSNIAILSMGIFTGASEGLQPLFGQSYGAKSEKDLKFYFKSGLMISFGGSVIITVLSVLLRACLKSFDKKGKVGDNRKKQAGAGENASISK